MVSPEVVLPLVAGSAFSIIAKSHEIGSMHRKIEDNAREIHASNPSMTPWVARVQAVKEIWGQPITHQEFISMVMRQWFKEVVMGVGIIAASGLAYESIEGSDQATWAAPALLFLMRFGIGFTAAHAGSLVRSYLGNRGSLR